MTSLDDPLYLIVLDHANVDQRNAVQAIVKVHSSAWWHQYADVWIAAGHTAAYWRDLITPVIRGPGTSVLVFKLPGSPGRAWAATGPNSAERCDWLYEFYTGSGSRLAPKALEK